VLEVPTHRNFLHSIGRFDRFNCCKEFYRFYSYTYSPPSRHHQDSFSAASRRHGRSPPAASGSSPTWVTPPTHSILTPTGCSHAFQNPSRGLNRAAPKTSPRPPPLRAATAYYRHLGRGGSRRRRRTGHGQRPAMAGAATAGEGVRLRRDAEAVLLTAPACARRWSSWPFAREAAVELGGPAEWRRSSWLLPAHGGGARRPCPRGHGRARGPRMRGGGSRLHTAVELIAVHAVAAELTAPTRAAVAELVASARMWQLCSWLPHAWWRRSSWPWWRRRGREKR
jgi:hypothetical protein